MTDLPTDNLPATIPARDLLVASPGPRPNRSASPPSCHRCGAAATNSWRRAATDAEREGHWAALEANIRSQPNLLDDSNASYTADHDWPVTKAVFGCDEHDLSPAPASDHDGSAEATAEAAAQAGLDARTPTHDADCGGHGSCGCGGAV